MSVPGGEIWGINLGKGLSEMTRWDIRMLVDALLDTLVDARTELKKRERP